VFSVRSVPRCYEQDELDAAVERVSSVESVDERVSSITAGV
jgi:hypothetical protein